MSSDVAVSLFMQRLLHEKYMEDSIVDSLIQGIIRGTGTSFSSKAAFIEHANNLLADIGFMLVRVIVAGKRYYSLKDLDSSNTSFDSLTHLTDRDRLIPAEYTEDDFKTPTRSLGDKFVGFSDTSEPLTSSAYPYRPLLKLNSSKFTHSELMVFVDSINTIISNGRPLPFKKQMSDESWSSLCSKRSIGDELSQINLFQRFERRKWLDYHRSELEVVPGVRFYFDLSNFFDLSNLNRCESCNTMILFDEFKCEDCKKEFHQECASSNATEGRVQQKKCFSCSIT